MCYLDEEVRLAPPVEPISWGAAQEWKGQGIRVVSVEVGGRIRGKGISGKTGSQVIQKRSLRKPVFGGVWQQN
jgi:hypothetical protein